jgi:hypothetical protein
MKNHQLVEVLPGLVVSFVPFRQTAEKTGTFRKFRTFQKLADYEKDYGGGDKRSSIALPLFFS